MVCQDVCECCAVFVVTFQTVVVRLLIHKYEQTDLLPAPAAALINDRLCIALTNVCV